MIDPRTKEGREELRRIASRVPDGPRVRIQRSVLVDLPEARCGRKSCYVTHLESSEPFSLEHAEMARAFDRPTVEALLDLADEQADRIAALEAENTEIHARLSEALDERDRLKMASGEEDDGREGCVLVAHDTGDGWELTVEDKDGECVAMLAWPESWPDFMKPSDFRKCGFEIV